MRGHLARGADPALEPRARSRLIAGAPQGWAEKFPPLRSAWEVLGPLQFEVAKKCQLPVDLPVLCGIHDGGANIARYLAAGLATSR